MPIESNILASFELGEIIGEGGMGRVYRAFHKERKTPVAIKVLTSKCAQKREYFDQFRLEAQSVAGLNHPHIITVYDYGEVDSKTEELSVGDFDSKSPYLIMEYASGGSLVEFRNNRSWSRLKDTILILLEALGHAHARGIIHRDLKPENILVCNEQDFRPGLKVADFGIAHPLDIHTDKGSLYAGTPAYMAPEQVHGNWRDYGPWTDLYSLGCMIYEFLCGTIPFKASNLHELYQAQLLQSPAPLHSHIPLPKGFDEWLSCLFEKDPRHRFQLAADAAWALRGLGDPLRDCFTNQEINVQGDLEITIFKESQSKNTAFSEDQIETSLDQLAQTVPHFPKELSETETASRKTKVRCHSQHPFHSRPSFTTDWRIHESRPPWMQLGGVGLGLYGLRTIPFIDRDEARGKIWKTLEEVYDSGNARLILLNGTAGNGKSRLAQWVSQRANELGYAIILRADHSPTPGPLDGLKRMLAQTIGCLGLSRKETANRVNSFLTNRGVFEPNDVFALTELILPFTEGEQGETDRMINFSRTAEKHFLIYRFLLLLSTERPVILWLDDIQWGAETLGFVEFIMNSQEQNPSPILLLLTVRDQALTERNLERESLENLLNRDNALKITIPLLESDDSIALVKELLGLEGSVAAKVVERTFGSPLFAIQLVGDLVARKALELTRNGFALRKSKELYVPQDVQEVWSAHLLRLLSNQKESFTAALELASVLGSKVDDLEWREAANHAMVNIPENLTEILFRNRLATPEDFGWSFVHGMLCEVLKKQAIEAGRYNSYHYACARMLQSLYPKKQTGVAERLGRHLIEAGEFEHSVGPLLQGAKELIKASRFWEALSHIEDREKALNQLGISQDDERWGEGWVTSSQAYSYLGKFSEAFDVGKTARDHSIKNDWKAILPESYRCMGLADIWRGNVMPAKEYFEQALPLFRQIGDKSGLANCLMALGKSMMHIGQISESIDVLNQALQIFESMQNPLGTSETNFNLAIAHTYSTQFEQAKTYLIRAIEIFEKAGCRHGVADCLNSFAEIDRANGDFEKAEKGYRNAYEIFASLGETDQYVAQYNLGLVILAKDDYLEALKIFEYLAQKMSEAGQYGFLPLVYSAQLPCLAVSGTWDRWDAHYKWINEKLASEPIVDPDIATMCLLAGDKAIEAGDEPRARKIYELSKEQWNALENKEKLQEVKMKIESLLN